MKMFPRRAPAAFSLVEVTLALGVAAFCLTAAFALLPVGFNSNQNSVAQTSAASIARAIAADLHNTPRTNNPASEQTSPIYKISVPFYDPGSSSPGPGTETHVLYVSDNGQPTGAIDTDTTPAVNPAYRVTVVLTAPPYKTSYYGTVSATPPPGKSVMVRILVTWNALADPAWKSKPTNYSGSFEVTTALDRSF